jgi:protein-disulfide isomerase-like protein with CxxC motif
MSVFSWCCGILHLVDDVTTLDALHCQVQQGAIRASSQVPAIMSQHQRQVMQRMSNLS